MPLVRRAAGSNIIRIDPSRTSGVVRNIPAATGVGEGLQALAAGGDVLAAGVAQRSERIRRAEEAAARARRIELKNRFEVRIKDLVRQAENDVRANPEIQVGERAASFSATAAERVQGVLGEIDDETVREAIGLKATDLISSTRARVRAEDIRTQLSNTVESAQSAAEVAATEAAGESNPQLRRLRMDEAFASIDELVDLGAIDRREAAIRKLRLAGRVDELRANAAVAAGRYEEAQAIAEGSRFLTLEQRTKLSERTLAAQLTDLRIQSQQESRADRQRRLAREARTLELMSRMAGGNIPTVEEIQQDMEAGSLTPAQGRTLLELREKALTEGFEPSSQTVLLGLRFSAQEVNTQEDFDSFRQALMARVNDGSLSIRDVPPLVELASTSARGGGIFRLEEVQFGEQVVVGAVSGKGGTLGLSSILGSTSDADKVAAARTLYRETVLAQQEREGKVDVQAAIDTTLDRMRVQFRPESLPTPLFSQGTDPESIMGTLEEARARLVQAVERGEIDPETYLRESTLLERWERARTAAGP